MAPNALLVNAPFPKADLVLASLVSNTASPNQDAFQGIRIKENEWSVSAFKDYSAFLEEGKQSLFEIALSAFYDSKEEEKFRVLAKQAQKYTLLQPREIFREAWKQAEVRSWVQDNLSSEIFFVVGFLTMTDATVIRKSDRKRDIEVHIGKMPAQGSASNLMPSDLDLQTKVQVDASTLDSEVYLVSGEQIFSICYRRLKLSWFSSDISLEGSNRWKLFTSNRGNKRGSKNFVEVEIDKGDYVPEDAGKIFRGQDFVFVVPS